MSTAGDPGQAPPAGPGRAAPRSCRDLFVAFTRLALQGFGGVLPVAQRELVERLGWLTKEEFLDMLSVSQVLPGPNIVILALMFGDRCFGWRGALASLAGMLLAPTVIVLAITALYARLVQYPMASGALRGMGAVASGLVVSTALKLWPALRRNRMGQATCVTFAALTVLASAWWRWPLAEVLVGLGAVAMSVAWWRTRV